MLPRKLVPLLLSLALAVTFVFSSVTALAAQEAEPVNDEETLWSAKTFRGLALRSIGPALTSGRIIDLAVEADNRKHYFVAVASGGVWETTNSGTTWKAIFDGEGSYSIGCLALDPRNPLVLWVGTGENNSQRSVGYGDGLYKSIDGGKSFTKIGLEESEHIGKIVIDPRDSDTVYVAAQGPLWRAGGDRGLYKTVDGGESWERILEIDEHTGVSDLVYDPRDPDILYAAAYQRGRRVWALINGGPGSAIYRSMDAGETWEKLSGGLPTEDMGRIGLALSPADPDRLYAIIEAAGDEGGFYRSTDQGNSWEKRSSYVSGSPQYYQELVAHPLLPDRVFSMDTYLQVTDDGGKTFRGAGQSSKHVDEHALWIDPDDGDYILAGGDGGIYESFDGGQSWHFKANLPITQFYKIAVDQDLPFYNVYGGTQDNFTLGGPSRTRYAHGIANRDWFITLGGDGFQPRIDPTNADTVYSQWQYGNLHRFDRRTGERVEIQPQPAEGDDPPRWNWDSPLLISPHDPSRLYFGSQRLFRSDDRGDSWQAVSGDLTRQLDRNQLEVMDQVWSVDAVAKNRSTSPYGNLTAAAESPLVEGLLYTGSDDGLLHAREGDDAEWRAIDDIPGIPEGNYVAHLEASQHQADRVYAVFNNHKAGDFAPYLLRSDDRGRSWRMINGDLPKRGPTWAFAEDPVDPDLLFAGTEVGVYFTRDGGEHWIRLQGGMPTISVRSLAIQERETDLVVGTFGRGIYILDDYAALRTVDPEAAAQLFAGRPARAYIEAMPLGLRGRSFQGDSFYLADNPPFGAVFTYYLKDGLETRREKRRKAEQEAREGEPESSDKGKGNGKKKAAEESPAKVPYPSVDELRAEDREKDPEVILTVRDGDGAVVRRLSGPAGSGFHRVAWNLRYPASDPAQLDPRPTSLFATEPRGPMVLPGTYTVELTSWIDGQETALTSAQEFRVIDLEDSPLSASERTAAHDFHRRTADLQRTLQGTLELADETASRLDHLAVALRSTVGIDPSLDQRVHELQNRLADLRIGLEGDPTMGRREMPQRPSVGTRLGRILRGRWGTTSAPTQTQKDSFAIASRQFSALLADLERLIDDDLTALETAAEGADAPWTPSRRPDWPAVPEGP
ncbi:MAG: glycosyl hydrolase [Acidobacteriota bacterium]